jgi:hypothetical protein
VTEITSIGSVVAFTEGNGTLPHRFVRHDEVAQWSAQEMSTLLSRSMELEAKAPVGRRPGDAHPVPTAGLSAAPGAGDAIASPSFGARLVSGGIAWSLAFAGLVLLLDSLGAAAR